MRKKLTKSYVSSLLSYNSKTGIFTWLVSRGSVKEGRIAGTVNNSRGKLYWVVKIDEAFYGAHKLAWLLEHNEWPKSLDHIDGNGLNNRIVNLRPCSMSQNKGNSLSYKNNHSGAKGVWFDKRLQKYRVTIQCNKKRVFVGMYVEFDVAKEAYAVAARKLFGEFARAA